MNDTDRERARRALSTVVKNEKNCSVLEKNIYKRSTPETFFWHVYQIIGAICTTSLPDALKTVKEGQLGWQAQIYKSVASKIAEFDEYLVHPFEIADGVVECIKCGSRKTWSVQKQTRASDEPMTTFSKCMQCGKAWRDGGH